MTEPSSIFDPRLRAATFSILLIVGLSAFEGLAVAAALPQLAGDLGSVSLLPWVISAYLLAAGVATVAAGALVDRIGVAPVYRVAVIVFIIGGVLAGLAPSMGILVAMRVIQGLGAGAVNSVGLAAVGLVYPRALVGRAFAANSTVWGVMSVASPAITAVLLGVASWRWVFLLNLPLGAIALAVGWRAMPARHEAKEGASLNVINLGLIIGFTVLSLVAVDALGWLSIPALAAAIACGVLVLRRGRGKANALIAPRHVIDRPLGPLAWAIALLLIGAIGTQSFVPLLVSGGRGAGATMTAWSVLFFVMGWTTGANVSSRVMQKRPVFATMQVAGSTVPLSLIATGVAALLGAPLPVLFVLLYFAGTGMGATTNSGLTLLQRLVVPAELGRATAAHQFIRNQGFALGNALVGAVLLFVVGRQTGDVELVRQVLTEGGGSDIANAGVSAAIETGFGIATLVSAAVAMLAVIPMLSLRRYLATRTDLDDVMSVAPPAGPLHENAVPVAATTITSVTADH